MKKLKSILIATAIVAGLCVWLLWGNKALTVTSITITNDKISDSFSGFKIVQISDLHNEEFGEGNYKLIEKLKQIAPNVIVLTGDIIDANRLNAEVSIAFAERVVDVAPTYYVTGNHEGAFQEYMPDEYDEYIYRMKQAGINILDDMEVTWTIGDDELSIIGINDFSVFRHGPNYSKGSQEESITERLGWFDYLKNYKILLSHRPELFDVYVENGVDLVLSGHAHGGQIRIPFIGGIYSPGQGLFPKYDSGVFTMGDTQMVVSRGLGNSRFPLRVNNRPEIIVVELRN